MDIVEKALSVRNNLVQCSVNPIDYSLGIVPPYIGSGDIKLIILTLRIIFSKESTEGIDKQLEAQQKIDQLLKELEAE